MAKLICLHRGPDDRPAVYCMPTASGSVSNYEGVAPILGLDRAVYGVRAVNQNETGELATFSSLREMAASIINMFPQGRLRGPLYLLGYSFGAPLAVEVAQQLKARGCVVPLVSVIDYQPTVSSFGRPTRIAHFLKYVMPWTTQIVARSVKDPKQRAHYYHDFIRRLRRQSKVEGDDWSKALPQERQDYVSHNVRAWRSHRFDGHYPGDILLLRQEPVATNFDPFRMAQLRDYGWRKVTGAKVEVIVVPGDHGSLMRNHMLSSLEQNYDARSARMTSTAPHLPRSELQR